MIKGNLDVKPGCETWMRNLERGALPHKSPDMEGGTTGTMEYFRKFKSNIEDIVKKSTVT